MSTRREFLAHAVWLIALAHAMRAAEVQANEPSTETGFSTIELQALRVVMDDIIPADDGMPSATAAGGMQYLQYLGWQYPNVLSEISRFLRTLEQESGARFGRAFAELQSNQRVQILATIEQQQKPSFLNFVGYVYESYYTRPQILGSLACQFPYLTTENNEELLAPVRRLTGLYREIPNEQKK